MAFTLGKFSFDKATVISIAVVIALLGVGYGVGTLAGQKTVQNEIIENGAAQKSLAGVVKSADKDGFKLEIDNSVTENGGAGISAPIGGAGGEEAKGTWTVKYGKGGTGVVSGIGVGTGGDQEVKKGDKVQVSGLEIGKNTVVAQSITKILPPTPSPTPSAKPEAKQTP